MKERESNYLKVAELTMQQGAWAHDLEMYLVLMEEDIATLGSDHNQEKQPSYLEQHDMQLDDQG